MVVQQVQPHYVVHLAALSFVGHGDANGFYSVNLAGTRNLLAALAGLSEKPRCVLLASSANVYGNAQEGVLAESAAVAPANDYAVSKLAMEYMAKLWQQELPIVITRPFNYTGQGQEEKFLIPKIVRHFRDRAAVIELGNLDVWRDFSDVRALVQAYAGLLERPAAIGKTVNICSGMALSLREVIAMCETISGHSLDVRVNPAFVRANEVKTLCGNPALLQSLLPGWQPVAFEQTLRWMLED
jgi:nucleoside-diphosphate-sugar epimerase